MEMNRPETPRQWITAAALHEQGQRQDQQDAWGISPCEAYDRQGVTAVLADGMGGLPNGKQVSNALVLAFLSQIQSESSDIEPQELLLHGAKAANQHIGTVQKGLSQKGGSTLAAVMMRRGRLHFLSVGDSRIYLWRNGGLIQLNRDQNYGQELALQYVNSQCSLETLRGDPQAAALTGYYSTGFLSLLDRSSHGIRLLDGDKVVLCTDGVYHGLPEEIMAGILGNDPVQAADSMGQLIAGMQIPGQDNYTAIILEYTDKAGACQAGR